MNAAGEPYGTRYVLVQALLLLRDTYANGEMPAPVTVPEPADLNALAASFGVKLHELQDVIDTLKELGFERTGTARKPQASNSPTFAEL